MEDSFQKEDVPHKEFLEDFGLLIIKNNLPIQFVESIWLKWLALCSCPKLKFSFKKQFSKEILLGLMDKTKQFHVLLALVECHSTTTNFDLWMSKRAYDVFALVINILRND